MLTWALIFLGLSIIVFFVCWLAFTGPFDAAKGERKLGFVEISDHRIHYIQKGKGPDLLLIHGIGANICCWDDVIDPLSEHFRVTALDLPGFGESDKKAHLAYSLDKQAARLNEFLEKIGIIKTNVLACSMGGTIVSWAAKQEPLRYGKLLLIAPSLNHKIAIIHPALYSWVQHVLGGWFVSPRIVRLVYSFVVAKPVTPEKIERYYRPFHQNKETVGVFAQSLHLVADRRLPSELNVLHQPIKILYGQKDRIIPFRMYDDVKKVLPRIEFEFHPQAGHHVMEDDPAWVIEKTIAYMK